MRVENNSAVVYVGSSVTLQNPFIVFCLPCFGGGAKPGKSALGTRLQTSQKHFTNDKILFSHLFSQLQQIMIYQLKFKVYRTSSFNLPDLRLVQLHGCLESLRVLITYFFSYHEYNQHSNDRH